MTDSSRAAVPAAPLFATVVFTNESDETVHTCRVPLSENTTVRRLAKDALQRLYHSTRNTNKEAQPSDFVVSMVQVGEPKAEIFGHDLVAQVVSVREEKVFMKLGNKALACTSGVEGGSSSTVNSTAAAASSLSSATPLAPSVAAAPLPTLSANTTSISPVAVSISPQLDSHQHHGGGGASMPLLESERSMDLTSTVPSTSRQLRPAGSMMEPATAASSFAAPHCSIQDPPHYRKLQAPPTMRSTAATFVRSPSPARVETPKVASSPSRAGNAARKKPVDSPAVQTVSKKLAVAVPRTSPKKNRLDGEQTTPEAFRVVNTENLTAREAARLKQKKSSDSNLGWGSDALANFPSNYLSNPDDVKKRLSARTAGSAVAREVFGSVSDDDRDDRAKIVFDSPIDVDALSPIEAERPKGWGAEATRFFPATYASDPTKAKLSEAEMNEPRRSRRRTEIKYTW